jgi:glutamate synthase (NADPH/NADH) small chain
MLSQPAWLPIGSILSSYANLDPIMVDATGMYGACMVPVNIDCKLVRKHACVDGPEIDGHIIDRDKFLPRFNLFKSQKVAGKAKRGGCKSNSYG